MKIRINLDGVGTPIDKLITNKLSNLDLPGCFGKMTLPILKKEVIVDDREYNILYPTKTLPVSERISPENIISGTDIKEFSITKESIKKINKIKEDRTNEYVSRISDCLNCKYSDICSKLTLNYLISISILIGGKE